jgi:hypothetical protein
VRRMCEAVGLEVRALHRSRYGPLVLAGLPRGEWRELTPSEVERLRTSSARPHGRSPRGGRGRPFRGATGPFTRRPTREPTETGPSRGPEQPPGSPPGERRSGAAGRPSGRARRQEERGRRWGADRPDRPRRKGWPGHGTGAHRSERATRGKRFERPDRGDRIERPTRGKRFGPPARGDRIERPARGERPGRPAGGKERGRGWGSRPRETGQGRVESGRGGRGRRASPGRLFGSRMGQNPERSAPPGARQWRRGPARPSKRPRRPTR